MARPFETAFDQLKLCMGIPLRVRSASCRELFLLDWYIVARI